MRKEIATMLLLMSMVTIIPAQAVVGTWVTTDDKTGEERSHIKIYMEEGELRGSIAKLLLSEAAEVCTKCSGDKKDQPIIGLEILSSMSGSDKNYKGRILDPENGKVYKCKLTLVEDDKIKLRGYIGTPMLGRTQYWHRLR